MRTMLFCYLTDGDDPGHTAAGGQELGPHSTPELSRGAFLLVKGESYAEKD